VRRQSEASTALWLTGVVERIEETIQSGVALRPRCLPPHSKLEDKMNEWEWQLLEDKTQLEHVIVSGVELKQGDRVRLKPRAGGDVFDLVLAGKIAVVEAIEQDYEGQAHLAVVVDDDPGRDLGLLRQPGHRFFFSPEEVEPITGKS
jgi:hypothetical protein